MAYEGTSYRDDDDDEDDDDDDDDERPRCRPPRVLRDEADADADAADDDDDDDHHHEMMLTLGHPRGILSHNPLDLESARRRPGGATGHAVITCHHFCDEAKRKHRYMIPVKYLFKFCLVVLCLYPL